MRRRILPVVPKKLPKILTSQYYLFLKHFLVVHAKHGTELMFSRIQNANIIKLAMTILP